MSQFSIWHDEIGGHGPVYFLIPSSKKRADFVIMIL